MSTLNQPYHEKLTFTGKSMGSVEASLLLEHKSTTQSTCIGMVDGIDLFLYGCATISTPAGLHLQGKSLLSIADAVDGVDNASILRFLKGESVPELNNYHILSKPWFGFEERDGEEVGEPFHDIPANIQNLVLN